MKTTDSWDVFEKLSEIIEKSSKITFFTGAGISTSAGIPDFRGPDGIYNLIEKTHKLPYPEAVFDINYFRTNPSVFYSFSKEMFKAEIKPTFTHTFISKLERLKKLAIVITQNIDMLHEKSGTVKVLDCHGSYKTAHCIKCGSLYNFKDFEDNLRNGIVRKCSCTGVVKPDIVFFGETLPQKFYDIMSDLPETDLLFVLGSSLTVQPANIFPLNIIKKYSPYSVIINNQSTCYDKLFDTVIHQDIDSVFKNVNMHLQY